MKPLVVVSAVLLLVACGGREPRDRPDGPPSGRLDVSRIEKPNPRPEPRSAYGNHSPYIVLGKTYHVLPSARGYRERGIASWYGTRFHGRRTSSGEPYDVYQLSAAHRTLPLPTWVEVRNLDNDRRIVVRVNDRGPFHPDRIIDLSWAAAVKLGIDHAGTAPVEVTAITFAGADSPLSRPARLPVTLQVGAFGEQRRAREVVEALRRAGIDRVDAQRSRTAAGRLWRVRVGPLDSAEMALDLIETIIALGFGRPQYVY